METSKTRSVSNTLAFSSIVLSIVCFVALVQVEVELHAHRKMLQVLSHYKEGNVAPSQIGNNELIAFPPHGYSSKEPHSRYKRSLKSKNKKSNTSVIVSRDDIKREVQLAMSSLACKVNCPKGRKGNSGAQGPKGDPGESISAPSIVSPPMSMVVNETGIASLQCEVKGNPTPQVTWLKQNSSLLADKRIIQHRGGLIIKNVTSQDGGLYTCKATNILGVTTSSAALTVQDINECSSNPCLNGGSCTDQVNGYDCSCQPGYAGTRCQSSVAVQWLHYAPQWCNVPYRRYLKYSTLEQCKQACLSAGCAAIEYWPVVGICFECLDHTKRRPFTNTFDSGYPPHVYIKQ